MQLLPSVGKANAKKEGHEGLSAGELLNPAINLQLGTRNLRSVLDRFGGQPEYALAAYNAGDVPVRKWMASGEYKDIRSSSNRSRIRRRASMCRRSCATARCTGCSTPGNEHAVR